MLLAARFLLGVGEGMVFPASNRLVAGLDSLEERGLANGLIFAGVGAGAGVTPPLITFILLHYGWRTSFCICAAIGLAAGLVWYRIARDRPEEHPWVKPAELEHIRSGLPKRMGLEAREKVPWRVILGSRSVWALTLSYFAFGYVSYIFFTWFFLYLSAVRGLDLKASAFFGMLPFLAMAAFSPLGGYFERPAHPPVWASRGPLRHSGGRDGRGGRLPRIGNAGARRPRGQHCAGGRRRGALSFHKLFLVGDRRYRRFLGRHGFGCDEHGQPDRRRGYGLFDPGAGQFLRMAFVISGGGGPLRDGGAGVAGG